MPPVFLLGVGRGLKLLQRAAPTLYPLGPRRWGGFTKKCQIPGNKIVTERSGRPPASSRSLRIWPPRLSPVLPYAPENQGRPINSVSFDFARCCPPSRRDNGSKEAAKLGGPTERGELATVGPAAGRRMDNVPRRERQLRCRAGSLCHSFSSHFTK
jgi:hypothetical protein